VANGYNLWHASFYNAYKDLPFDKVDDDIKDASNTALIDYLQRRFDNYRLIALKDSYSLILAYKDEQLVGYTLYHMLEQHAIIHIDHFAVDPTCQGKGIGKKLLEETIKSKPETIAVVLTTRILNKPAKCFYKQQGFYELNSIDNLVFDSRYSILLRKDIKS
jgi:ribosomal protein S18 acetylase RimI-like enzyme